MKGFCLRLTLAALTSTLVFSVPTESSALGGRCRRNCNPVQQPQQPQPQPQPSQPETPGGVVLPHQPNLRQCRLLPRMFGRDRIINGFEEKVGNAMARILSGMQQANALFGTCRFFPASARNACCKKFQSSALDKCTQDVASSGGSDCNSRQLGARCCASLTAQAKEQLTQFCAQAVAQVSNGCEVPETPTPEPTIPLEDPGLPVVSLPSNSDAPTEPSPIPDPTGDWVTPGATNEVSARY